MRCKRGKSILPPTGQSRQEVVSYEEAEQNDVVQHVLEVVRELDHALQEPEFALEILAKHRQLQDLQGLLHVFALARQRSARLRLFALTLRGSTREIEGFKNKQVAIGAAQRAASDLQRAGRDFFSKDVEIRLVRGEAEHDEIGIEPVNDVSTSTNTVKTHFVFGS